MISRPTDRLVAGFALTLLTLIPVTTWSQGPIGSPDATFRGFVHPWQSIGDSCHDAHPILESRMELQTQAVVLGYERNHGSALKAG